MDAEAGRTPFLKKKCRTKCHKISLKGTIEIIYYIDQNGFGSPHV
jgi:hypothetical protein